MSNLTNYILKGAIATVAGIALGETILVAIDTIRVRKEILKSLKEDPEVSNEDYEELRKSYKPVMKSIKIAAKKRVEQIKKDPAAEICAIWGCTTYLIGNWKGSMRGFVNGWNLGTEDGDKIIDVMRKYAPNEFNSMIEKVRKNGPDKVMLSYFNIGEDFHSSSWLPSECKLAEVIDTVAKEVKS